MATVMKQEAAKMLPNAPAEKVFWCNDGQILSNLKDMESALNNMSDDTFGYHANDQKNDFANWVRDVFGDQKLSNDLVKARSRAQAAKAVSQRIASLSAPAKRSR
ncbi:MAG: hypothetical protein HY667_00370 [Chloroflexi bacterium]|nr:hypothetical protein [Chloroflexota bacterium]